MGNQKVTPCLVLKIRLTVRHILVGGGFKGAASPNKGHLCLTNDILAWTAPHAALSVCHGSVGCVGSGGEVGCRQLGLMDGLI